MNTNLDEISPKQIQELEELTLKLLNAMKKTSLRTEAVYEELTQLEKQLSNIRTARFDSANPTFTR